MPTSALALIPQTYPELLRCMRRVLIDGQREIDRVWVRSYHEIRLRPVRRAQGYGGPAGRLVFIGSSLFSVGMRSAGIVFGLNF